MQDQELVNQYERLKSDPVLALGIYKHYKNGHYYSLFAQGLHTETKEKLAVYRGRYEPYDVFVRPWDMFFDIVEHEGKQVPRFEMVST